MRAARQAQTQRAVQRSADLAGFLDRIDHVAIGGRGLIEQDPPGLGQLDTAGGADDEAHAQLVLQRFELKADGRGADPQGARRAAQRPLADNRQKDFDTIGRGALHYLEIPNTAFT